MIQYYSFDVIVTQNEIENLFVECIVDGFSGYSELIENEKTRINVCFRDKSVANQVRKSLLQNQKIEASQIQKIKNRDWNEEWKKTISPVKITDKIWVSPKWLKPKISKGESWIKIEPRMAFGTGHHETTRIAAKLIEQSFNAKTLLDIGTGSGVLAFVAQICGYESITGIETDEDCRENLFENLKDNRANSDIRFVIGGIEEVKNSAKFDTVAMNMISSQSIPLLKNIYEILQENGILLWSGILLEEKAKIIEKAKKFGFGLQNEIVENEWWGAEFAKIS
jgi:ribosomal protein L11 methyltransferase